MAEYLFKRELVGTKYNVENYYHVDGALNHIYLSKEVEAALPGKKFKMFGIGSDLKFIFELDLSSPEQTTLNNCVIAQKINTGE